MALATQMHELKELIAKYNQDNIFNINVSKLFYNVFELNNFQLEY